MTPTHRFPAFSAAGRAGSARVPARRGRVYRWLGAAAVAAGMLGPLPAAAQQLCVDNQAQLSQAINDSRSALTASSATLDRFSAALIGPRSGPVDAEPVISAGGQLDAYIRALSDFSTQVTQIGQECGPQFAADGQALAGLVAQFEAERTRAGQLLEEHRKLSGSGEPPMSQAQMEAVQQALRDQGFYQSSIDGRFGSGTRSAIAAWQAAGGRQGTGYLTAEELAQLVAQPVAGQGPGDGGQAGGSTADGGQGASPLPPAPPADGGGTATAEADSGPANPLSDEASRICTQNIDAVEDAAAQARTFREGMLPRLSAYRAAIRGPRVPDIDGGEAGRMSSEVSAFIDPMEGFHDQAEGVLGQCGAGFDASYEDLGAQIASLRTLLQRIEQAKSAWEELVASGEPAMDGAAMRGVQAGLRNLGHYNGAIDALFGSGTRAAIRAYQGSVGADETGYLTAGQVAALREAAETPPAPPEPETPAPVPEAPPPPPPGDAAAPPPAGPAGTADAAVSGPPQIADVRRILFADIDRRPVPDPLSGLSAGDGRLGDLWWQGREDVAQGRAQEAVAGRLALFGAAYLDRGAESPAMVDAHLLVGEAFARLRLYGDAAFHLQRAYDIWTGLGRDDPGEGAMLQERLATALLAEAVANGTVGGARFDDVLRLLDQARSSAGVADAALDRLTDLYVAAGRAPSDAEVAAAIRERYGS